jgi:glutaredoxin
MGVYSDAKDFLKEPFNLYLTVGLVVLGLALILSSPAAQESGPASKLQVDFFYMPTCPHCAEQKPLNEKLMVEFPEVKFIYHDVTSPDGAALLRQMAVERGLDTRVLGVPATFFGNKSFIGYDSEETTGKQIRGAIAGCLETCEILPSETISTSTEERIKLPIIGEMNPKEYSLPALAVILGLIDGFNPCAMWVLVYLIALLMNLNDRKKIWFIVGSFVMASGVLYFLFMTAWLNAFLLLGYMRAVTVLIGIVALGGGILSIREYITTKGALVCKVGDAGSKRGTIARLEEIVASPLTIPTVAAIIALAFVVNSVEFVCSSAIPAVFTQVLALANISSLEHYGYIALYDFFFMLDDLIVFGLAAFAISGGVGEKYAKYCKIIGGAILLLLGLMLLFAPQMLR